MKWKRTRRTKFMVVNTNDTNNAVRRDTARTCIRRAHIHDKFCRLLLTIVMVLIELTALEHRLNPLIRLNRYRAVVLSPPLSYQAEIQSLEFGSGYRGFFFFSYPCACL